MGRSQRSIDWKRLALLLWECEFLWTRQSIVADVLAPSIGWFCGITQTLNSQSVTASSYSDWTFLSPGRSIWILNSPEFFGSFLTPTIDNNVVIVIIRSSCIFKNSFVVCFELESSWNSTNNRASSHNLCCHSFLSPKSFHCSNAINLWISLSFTIFFSPTSLASTLRSTRKSIGVTFGFIRIAARIRDVVSEDPS